MSTTTPSHQETVDDIEQTLGLLPGFLEALPEEDLTAEWPIFKKYALDETAIPGEYRELIGLAVAANIKCRTANTSTGRPHNSTARPERR